MSKLLSNLLQEHNATSHALSDVSQDTFVHSYASNSGYIPFDSPRLASSQNCPFCGDSSYFVFNLTAEKKAWICGRVCELSKLPKEDKATTIETPPSRALQWPLFCEKNGIGNTYHDLCFEKVNQSPQKLEFLLNFAKKPQNLIIMQGSSGTGKTYACLGLCELFTRKSISCLFFTQKTLMDKWLCSYKEGVQTLLTEKLKLPSLLILDDFGSYAPSPGFLDFFMDILDHRLQWTDKGTVITTNLLDNQISSYCGSALSDRIRTGQLFTFSGQSRRFKPVL